MTHARRGSNFERYLGLDQLHALIANVGYGVKGRNKRMPAIGPANN
jgi:hypothetical protein